MKGELLKLDNGWMLLIDKVIYATDNDKLSINNCQAIENGYDLDELAGEWVYKITDEEQRVNARMDFEQGFKKAMELMEGKKYSEEDMRKAYNDGMGNIDNDGCRIDNADIDFKDTIDCMQEYKWEVEISEVLVGECEGNNDNGCFMDQCGQNCGCFKKELNLDKDGCLILKRL